jgi:hypothetical protein
MWACLFISVVYFPCSCLFISVVYFPCSCLFISVVYFPCSCLFVSVVYFPCSCLFVSLVCLFPLRALTSLQWCSLTAVQIHTHTQIPDPHFPFATWQMGIWDLAHGTWPPGTWHMATWHMATWHMGTWHMGTRGKSKTRQRASQRNWRNQLLYVFNCCFRAEVLSNRVAPVTRGWGA